MLLVQFSLKKQKKLNNNRKIGLIWVADTCMGGHVIASMQLLQLEDAAKATVATMEFNNDKVSDSVVAILIYKYLPKIFHMFFIACRC